MPYNLIIYKPRINSWDMDSMDRDFDNVPRIVLDFVHS